MPSKLAANTRAGTEAEHNGVRVGELVELVGASVVDAAEHWIRPENDKVAKAIAFTNPILQYSEVL